MPPRPALSRRPRRAPARGTWSRTFAALVRARARAGLLAAIAGTAALAGCYETPTPACTFACALDDSCPSGYACDPQDRICHRELPGGGLEACDRPYVDAAITDARTDAPAIDAGTDAATDAAIDAAVDAP